MRRSACVALVLLALSVTGCERSKPAMSTADAQSPSPSESKAPDNWQKMKDCAAAADNFLKTEDRSTVLGFLNHYNSKDNRCYVQVTRRNRLAGPDMARLYSEFFDAFEGRVLASCTDDPAPLAHGFCHVQSLDSKHQADCPFCRSFTKQLMSD